MNPVNPTPDNVYYYSGGQDKFNKDESNVLDKATLQKYEDAVKDLLLQEAQSVYQNYNSTIKNWDPNRKEGLIEEFQTNSSESFDELKNAVSDRLKRMFPNESDKIDKFVNTTLQKFNADETNALVHNLNQYPGTIT